MSRFVRSAFGLTAALLVAAPAAAVPLDRTVLVSAPVGAGPLVPPVVNASSTADGKRTVSGDGRYVVFSSFADGLSTEDDNTVANVYVRDRQTNQTLLASRATGAAGAGANGASGNAAISGNGRFVVFSSSATNLSDADEGGVTHVFVRDLIAGTTELVDRANGVAGVIGNDAASGPAISDDGDKVVFESQATNLGVAGGFTHIYVRDRSADTNAIADLANGSASVVADLPSFSPDVAGDGSAVVFATSATNMNAGLNPTSSVQIYWRSLTTTVTQAVSAGAIALGNGDSTAPSISTDGSRVAFTTRASDVDNAGDDPDATDDVYVWFDASNTRVLVSRATGAAGAKGTAPARSPVIAPSGTAVAFSTAAPLDPVNDTNVAEDTYLRLLADASLVEGQNSTKLVSRDGNAGQAAGGSTSPSLTTNGLGVVFTTTGDGVGPDDDDEFPNVYLRTMNVLVLGTVVRNTLVSRPSGVAPFRAGVSGSELRAPNRSDSALRAVSADGRRVAFVSSDDTLSTADGDRVWNVFVRDVLTGTTELVSRATGVAGAAANGDSSVISVGVALASVPPAMSADGTRVAFVSSASNLVAGDTNAAPDLFVRDLTTHVTTRVSLADNESQLTFGAFEGTISGDGRVVAFTTRDALSAADTNGIRADVYVRNLAAGTTVLASRRTGANGLVDPNDDSSEPSLDLDGSRVAFSGVGDLAPAGDDTNIRADVYLRDLVAATTTLVSQREAAGQPRVGTDASVHPAIDASGTRVAFASASPNLVNADANAGVSDIFVRDVVAGTTRTASVVTGTTVEGNGASSAPSISSEGTRVGFTSAASNLVAGDADGRPDVFVRDLATGATILASRADGAGGAAVGATFGSISGNGDCMAFASPSDAAAPGLPAGTDFSRVFLRALRTECPLDPPETSIVGRVATRDRTPTFKLVSDEPGSTFRCRRGKAAFAACAGSVTLPRLKDGRYTLQAIATDPAGQVDATPATLRFTVDTVRPRIRSASTSSPLRTSARVRVRLSEAVTLGIVVQRLSGGRYRTVATVTRSLKAGRRSVTLPRKIAGKRLPAGAYRLRLTATDAAGNRSKARTVRLRVR